MEMNVGCAGAAKVSTRMLGHSLEVQHNACVQVEWTDDQGERHVEDGPFSRGCGVTARYPKRR